MADKPYAGSTLQWAASRLRRAAGSGGKRKVVEQGRMRRAATAASGIRMAEVVRRSGMASKVADVVVDVAGARILVRRGFDTALLRDVVRALREGR